MTGAPRPDRPGPHDVDRGTQLGVGTRILAALFRTPVRATRAVARGLARLGSVGRGTWLVVAIALIAVALACAVAIAGPRESASATGDVGLTIVTWALAFGVVVVLPLLLLVGLARAAPSIGRAVARAARFLWRPFRGRLRPILHAVGTAIGTAIGFVVRPIGRAIAYVATHIGRALAFVATHVGHAVAFVAVRIGRAIAYVATHIGHALTYLATHIGHAVAFVAVRIGRAIAYVATHIGHALTYLATHIGHALTYLATHVGRAIAYVATHIGHALTYLATHVGRAIAYVATHIGHAIARVAVPIGHAIGIAARAVHHAIGIAARAIGHGLTAAGRGVGVVLAVVFTPVGRGIARLASTVSRVVLVPLGRVLAAIVAACGRVANRVVDRIVAFVAACARWIQLRVLRLRHSIGVAAARARQAGATVAATPTAREGRRVAAPPPPFTAEVFHNEYLPSGGRTVDAVITVTAHADPEPAGERIATAEVLLVDCSGSMGQPWRKIRAARGATVAAIDALPDGTSFAVVRANHDAEVVYPDHGGLATKDARTAADARRAVQALWPEGGTAMGRWLLLARDLLATEPHAIGHAILLTDGRNESESSDALATATRACRGRFQCDCRGVGTDWDVAELRGIAQELLGTVDIVADPTDLAADFRAMAQHAGAKRVGGVTLRVWTPTESTVKFIRQVSPQIADLAERPVRVDARTVDYPTGAWSDESRDYHLSIELPDKPAGTEMLAARVSLVVGGHVLSKALVRATWTEDLELSTRIVPEVVHYTGQAELLGAVQEGLERRRSGDEVGALTRLGEAARRAHETGNDATLQLIANVVEIEDAVTGRVRARATVDDADLMALETRSTRTQRFAGTVTPD